jgi:chromosome segregation ATPase
MEIRETRPWFWVLVAALAVVAIGGLVLAIAAGNEGVDQKAAVDEATEQIQGEVAGLNEAVEAANEIQAETDESAAADRKRIKRDVETATADGEAELNKLKKRVRAVEGESESLAATDQKLERSVSNLTKSGENLEAQIEEMEAEVQGLALQPARSEKKSEKAQTGAP